MNHIIIEIILISGVFIAYFIGKIRGFKEGVHIADDIIYERDCEIFELNTKNAGITL